jgi:diacylglycerol kinase family enzyme
MIRDTDTESKQRLGRLAYLWTAAKGLSGFQPRRFLLTIDDNSPRMVRASEVLVANVGTFGQPPFQWGPDIHPDDGELTVCVLRVRSLLDSIRLGVNVLRGAPRRDPSTRYFKARARVQIAMVRASKPLPVQGDGEIIGETPVEVHLQGAAVRVIVPPRAAEEPKHTTA